MAAVHRLSACMLVLCLTTVGASCRTVSSTAAAPPDAGSPDTRTSSPPDSQKTGTRTSSPTVARASDTQSASPPDIRPPATRTPTITLPMPAVVRGPGARETLQHIADSVVNAPMWANAQWGMLVVDAENGDTLITRNADKLFIPASNQKLLTAAVALQVLGADYRWKTPVFLRGRKSGSTWNGDLVIVGSGDPSWSDTLRNNNVLSTLDPIVEALAKRGIRRINGRVVAEGDLFTGITTGLGWEVDDLDETYGAVVDELVLNEGVLRLTVHAGTTVGTALHATRYPTTAYPPIVMRATAGNRERLRAVYDSTASAIVITGSLAAGDSAHFEIAYRHPADAVRAGIVQRLVAAGVSIDSLSPGKASCCASNAVLDTLAVIESVPFPKIIERMFKSSQNQVAELLFRTSGVVGSHDGSADSARAVAARVLATLGVSGEEVAYRDGSGMSRHDYVTPRALVKVLDAVRRSPSFTMFHDALPNAGIDGTLRNRMRNTPAQGNAHAKTGSVDKVRSLSGYAHSADGHLVMYSLIANNYTVASSETARVQDLIVVALASMRIRDAAPAR